MAEKKIHLVIPMSGVGARFQAKGYKDPKPLIPVSGTPMIERVLSHFPTTWPAHFILSEQQKSTKLPGMLTGLRPDASLNYVAPHKKGPSYALLKAIEDVPMDEPVLVSYCDYGMVWDATQFEHFVRSSACDACVISYRGFHAHYLSPVMYAYSRLENGRVVEVKEKGCFTSDRENEFASSGGYYFKSGRLLKEAIEAQIKKDLSLNKEYYTSLTVEALLQTNKDADVRVFEIPGFYQWGTPEDLEIFEYWEKTMKAVNRDPSPRVPVDHVLMPMAGLGSRFQGLFPQPKPFIPVDDKPIFQWALDSLPKAKKTVLVMLEEVKDQIPKDRKGALTPVFLKKTPDGQALSTEAGLGSLDKKGDVIVSACDHRVVFDSNQWDQFRKNPDCDAAIFTVTGYPGVQRKPPAYAYVEYESSSAPFPLVKAVSVKKPISDRPARDPLLVGTFWFRSAAVMEKGINELKKRDVRVNGELYLDSIFSLLQEMGMKVRGFPLAGYINMGDPDSLAEAVYWQDQLGGYRLAHRKRFPTTS